jgi:hypothetical protein
MMWLGGLGARSFIHRHRWNFRGRFLAIPFRETLHDLLGNKFMEAKVPPRSKRIFVCR